MLRLVHGKLPRNCGKFTWEFPCNKYALIVVRVGWNPTLLRR